MYQRIESTKGYKRITTVDTNGDYVQIVKFDDGTITSYYQDNIFKMGWKSLNEFLNFRKGFAHIKGGETNAKV